LPELVVTRRAEEDVEALPTAVREAVDAALLALAADPEGFGRALRGRLRGLWSARVGSYRVLYTIEQNRVIVRAVKHRAVAYRGRP
jgi:mRNA-degrading endonuclease RelE of RelBE toxin-antitoxin system